MIGQILFVVGIVVRLHLDLDADMRCVSAWGCILVEDRANTAADMVDYRDAGDCELSLGQCSMEFQETKSG